MTAIAIIGPGAIGGTIAALMSEAAHDVTLCARTPFERLIVETRDRTIELRTPRVLIDPKSASARAEWIITVTKTYDTEGARRWIDALLGPSTVGVAIVQNGVEHADRFPDLAARALPVIINVPAERSAPGRIRQRGPGTITVPETELGRGFVRLFERVDSSLLTAATTRDFTTIAWKKLVVNSAGVVSALTLKPSGIVHHAKARALIRGIALETIAVGKAVGADLSESLADDVITRLEAALPDSVNSILADRLAGRPTEIDARNGVIVRLGAHYAIPTPLNAMAVALIESAT